MIPVGEDAYVDAMQKIAKKQGVVMTGAMILQEIENAPKQAKTKKKGPKRVALYIDGSNLFGGQYELFGPKPFVLSNFCGKIFKVMLNWVKKWGLKFL